MEMTKTLFIFKENRLNVIDVTVIVLLMRYTYYHDMIIDIYGIVRTSTLIMFVERGFSLVLHPLSYHNSTKICISRKIRIMMIKKH